MSGIGVRISGFGPEVTNAALRELCTPYGARRCAVAFRHVGAENIQLGWGIAMFDDPAEADKAAAELDGRAALGASHISAMRATDDELEYAFEKPASKKQKRDPAPPPPLAEPAGVMKAFFGGGGGGGAASPSTTAPQDPPPSWASQQPQGRGWGDDPPPAWRGGRFRGREGRGLMRGGGRGWVPRGAPPPPPPQAMQPQPVLVAVPQRSPSPMRELELSRITDMKKHPFFVVAFQVACESQRVRLPIEAAVVAFTLGTGEQASFHTILSPGAVPSALADNAWWQTRRVHGIHADYAHSERHYLDVWNRLLQFLRVYWGPGYDTFAPTFFSKPAERSSACLGWLAKMAGHTHSTAAYPLPRVQPLENLIDHVSRATARPLKTTEVQDLLTPLAGKEPDPQKCCPFHANPQGEVNRCALNDAREMITVVCSLFNKTNST